MTRPRATLLIHAGTLGDFVLAAHAAHRVRAAAGGTLDALCRARIACHLTQRGALDGWKWIEGPRFAGLWRDDHDDDDDDLARFLAAFDTVITMLGGDDDPTTRRLRARHAGRVVAVDPHPCDHRPIVDQWTAALAAAGLPVDGSAILQAPSPPPTDRIIVHPGSGGLDKCWPLERFESVAEALAAGADLRFMIGPDELERHGAALVRRLERRAAVLCHPDVCDAAAALAGARLYIGNDAGMTHVAALHGIPTLQIFTTTAPAVWQACGPVTALVDPSVPAVLEAARA